MPTCGYLVVTDEQTFAQVAERLGNLPGCEVVRARNRPLLILVTETDGPEEDEALRRHLQGMAGIHALLLAFGEIDPETSRGDPAASARKAGRRLPVRTSRRPDGPRELPGGDG